MRHQSDCRERNRNNCCILYLYLYYLNFSIVWLIELASYRPDPNVCFYIVMLCLLFSTCFLISEIAECIFPPPFKSLGLWNVETWDELERFAQTRDRSLCWVLQCKVQSAKFGLDFLLPSPFYRCFHHHHHRPSSSSSSWRFMGSVPVGVKRMLNYLTLFGPVCRLHTECR